MSCIYVFSRSYASGDDSSSDSGGEEFKMEDMFKSSDLKTSSSSSSSSSSNSSSAAVLPQVVAQPSFSLTVMNSAPQVEVDSTGTLTRYVDPLKKDALTDYNPTVEEMWRPLSGPFRPNRRGRGSKAAQSQGVAQNAVTGWAEKTYVDQHAFSEQYQTFQNYGYAANPSVNVQAKNQTIGDTGAFDEKNGMYIYIMYCPLRLIKRYNHPMLYILPGCVITLITLIILISSR